MKKYLILASVSVALGGCASMQQKIEPYIPHHHKLVKAEPKPIVIPVKPVEPGTFEVKPVETPKEQIKRRWFPRILRPKADQK